MRCFFRKTDVNYFFYLFTFLLSYFFITFVPKL